MNTQYYILIKPNHEHHNKHNVYDALRLMYNDDVIQGYESLNEYKKTSYGCEELFLISIDEIIDFFSILESYIFHKD